MTKVKTKPWSTTNHRFVCFLDIIGFKNMVMRNPHNEIYTLLSELSKQRKAIEDTKDLPFEFNFLKTVSFSDSIIIFTKDDSLKSFELLSASVSWLFKNAPSLFLV